MSWDPTLHQDEENLRWSLLRAMLKVGMDGPYLSLSDENGKTRTGVSAFKGDPSLILFGPDSKIILSVPKP